MLIASLLLAVTVVAREPGYTTTLAKHVQRWLAGEAVAAKVVPAAQMAKALDGERIAFLVGFSQTTADEMETLRRFAGRGGKIVAFHSASPALGALMGVKTLGYAAAPYPGAWSRMDFSSKIPAGLPASIRQTSTVLHRARPDPQRARTIAVWADRTGRSTGEPAWIASSAGFWMTHVLLADGDEDLKAQLLGAIVGSIDPKAWSPAAHRSRRAAAASATRDYALAQKPAKGEIRAVWDQSGCGLYPGDWGRTMRTLRSSGVTDAFVNFSGAAFAHYPSKFLPRSKTYAQEGDQVSACLAAAKGTGVRIHAWVMCFTTERGAPGAAEAIAKKGWRLSNSAGRQVSGLDPSNPAVREHVLSAISEIQAMYPALAGVHLDFVRWATDAAKPRGAANAISSFVADARRRVKRPKWLTAAVFGKYPGCILSVGQDWYGWLESGIVDYVVPMDYTESAKALEALFAQHASPPRHARRTIAGLGVTSGESRLDARKTIEQIVLARRYGLAGVSLFDLDATLEKNILPYLRMGVWRE